jgi:hypothetical protein
MIKIGTPASALAREIRLARLTHPSWQPSEGNYGVAVPLSDWSKDNFVAPEMSKFTHASLPDMSETDPQQGHWLANSILNNLLGPRRWLTPWYQQMYNMLRRSHAAFAEYDQAREATLAYLENPDDIMRYVAAVGHWEKFLADAWQAYDFFGGGRPTHYEKNDGSVLQRLHALHNQAKHAASTIAGGEAQAEGPLAVWLTNEGLRSPDTMLNFHEIVEVLKDIACLADALQDPQSAQEKLRAYAEDDNT